MASNQAARRAAKANRRKTVVAQKRRAESRAGSLAARAASAATMPILVCLINEGWQDGGMASVFLVRGASAHDVTVGMFLLDMYCLGIKDVGFQSLDGKEFRALMASAEETMVLTEIDPSRARKLIRDLADWARSLGFSPHRDFAAVERLFGTICADDCADEFQFGLEGKPVYMPSSLETPRQIRRRLMQIAQIDDAEVALPFDDMEDEGVVEGEIVAEEIAAIAK
jgi:hypothetical protein